MAYIVLMEGGIWDILYLHGMCLPTGCLSVGKYGSIVPTQNICRGYHVTSHVIIVWVM